MSEQAKKPQPKQIQPQQKQTSRGEEIDLDESEDAALDAAWEKLDKEAAELKQNTNAGR